MRCQVLSTVFLCVYFTLSVFTRQEVEAEELTPTAGAIQAVQDPQIRAVRIEAFFETTDGSAQLGMIVDRGRGGRIKFQYCDGQTVDLTEKDLRKSEANCEWSGGKGKPSWTIAYKEGSGEFVSGGTAIPCTKLAASIRSAVSSASASSAVGTVYSPFDAAGEQVEITDSMSSTAATPSMVQDVPPGCQTSADVMAIGLVPWTQALQDKGVVGVYVGGGATGTAASP